jgi:hypothetical protein
MPTGLKLVLMYLCDLANKDTQIAFPSIATIAKELECLKNKYEDGLML